MHDALWGCEGKSQPGVRCFEILRHRQITPRTQGIRAGSGDGDVSGWVLPRDVVLQLLDGLFLLGDDPLHQVANRDHSHYMLAFHDRQMAYAVVGHDGHALIHGVLRSYVDHRARHDLLYLGFLRGSALEDDLASVIAL